MPRPSAIRWRKQDREKVSRTVQQFNAKLTRTLKKNPLWKTYLPDRLNVKEVLDKIETRQDFNRIINQYQRFLRRGAEAPLLTEKGVRTTEWQRREMAIQVATINRARTRERKAAGLSFFKGNMNLSKNWDLIPKKFDINTIGPKFWDKYVANIENQVRANYNSEKMEQYKKNYLKALEENYGGFEGYDRLRNMIEALPPEFFYRQYYDDPILQLDFLYDPSQSEAVLQGAMAHWENAIAKAS